MSVINDTAAIFDAANNEAVFVWNGDTYFVSANGTAYPVCKASATCAALYVDDEDEKEQLEEKATAALVAGGFVEAVERRRLGDDWCLVSSSRYRGPPFHPSLEPPDDIIN